MKVSVISFNVRGLNMGTILQNCALAEQIRVLGYEVEFINLKIQYGFHKVIILRNIIFFPFIKMRLRKCINYVKMHYQLTKYYRNSKELIIDPPVADIYVSGSDQIWNINYKHAGKDAYFLTFTNSPNKISYASSLGQLFNEKQLDFINEKIKGYKYISVRENKSRPQMIKAGIPHVQHVLDPVFLMSKEYYQQRALPNKYGKYLFVYNIDKGSLMDNITQEYAKKYQCKIIAMGGYYNTIRNCDIFDRTAGPIEFLTYLCNAEYVLTDSFHGASLSMILEKKFLVVLPRACNLRLLDILESTGLQNQIVYDTTELDKVNVDIDYNMVNKRLQSLIEKSKQFLKDSLANMQR